MTSVDDETRASSTGRSEAAAASAPLRPRDAATLIIVDKGETRPRLLMGRRAAGHVFMAGKYVFPGGRVEPDDLRLARDFPLSEPVAARLTGATTARFDSRRAASLALASIRETFEEVGVMIGTADGSAVPGRSWAPFAEFGIRPDPRSLVPLARAITPPGRSRRFDARFFCVSADRIARIRPFDERPTDEFDTVAWFTFEELKSLELARITKAVLGDLETRLEDGSWQDPGLPMPFYRMRHKRFVREMV